MNRKVIPIVFMTVFGLLACNFLTPGQDPTPTMEITRTVEASPVLTETDAPQATVLPSPTPAETAIIETTIPPLPTPVDMNIPPEAIMILEPGPGSRVVSPLRVTGEADPTFEQSLGVALILEDGTQLAIIPAQIQADLGERGPFSVDVSFTVPEERQAFLQVFSDSARDGGITHLSTVGLTLLPAGEAQIVRREPYPEQIHITSPTLGAVVRGGLVRVEGIAIASFEQTLIVELLDEDGSVLVTQPITLTAEELGVHAPFTIDLIYSVARAQAGRVVVRDPSPAFPGDQHLSSVEIRLEP
jgi:hypothetical protein